MRKILSSFLVASLFLLSFEIASALAPKCDDSMLELLEAKQACYLNGDCLGLAVAATGGAAGGFAGKALKSLLGKQPPEVQQKFLQAVGEIKNERVVANSAWEQYQKAKDKAYEESTKGKYKTEREYRVSNSGGKAPSDVQAKFEENLAKLLKSDLPQDVKDSLSVIQTKGEAALDSRLQEKIAKIFPQEGEALRQLYQQRAVALRKQAALNPYEYQLDKGIQSDNPDLYSRLQEEIEGIDRKILKLTRKSGRFSLVDQLMNQGSASLHVKSVRRGIFETARRVVGQETRAQAKGANGKAGIAGAGLMTALTATAEIKEMISGQEDIRSCQKFYGFSDAEISYLGKGSVFRIAKAKKQGGSRCEDLSLVGPQNEAAEIKGKWGQIPPGICKMIQQQILNLDQLAGESVANPDPSCNQIKDTNYSVSRSADQDVFEYRDGAYTYKLPFYEQDGQSYPDFRWLKAFDEKGQEVKSESLKLQDFYNQIHPPSVTETRPDLTDVLFSCRDTNKLPQVALFCRIRQSAIRARAVHSIRQSICSFFEEGAAAASGGKAGAGAGSGTKAESSK